MADEELTTIFDFSVVAETKVDVDAGRPPSVAIVEAVASAEDVPPTDLPPLYETVDTDAIDKLFSRPPAQDGATLTVQILLDEWVVVVRDDGTVTVGSHDQSAGAETAPGSLTGD